MYAFPFHTFRGGISLLEQVCEGVIKKDDRAALGKKGFIRKIGFFAMITNSKLYDGDHRQRPLV